MDTPPSPLALQPVPSSSWSPPAFGHPAAGPDPPVRLFAFAGPSRGQLWFVGELVSLVELERAYDGWKALETRGTFVTDEAERVSVDKDHPLTRLHRMHRNWSFLLAHHWRRVLSFPPHSTYPSAVAASSLFGELLLSSFRALGGMLPRSPADFDLVVGFDLVHDVASCPLSSSCTGAESCLVPVRALFLGEYPLVGPVRSSPVLAASPCITASSPSLGPAGFVRHPRRHGTDSGSEASSLSAGSLILSYRQSDDDDLDAFFGAPPGGAQKMMEGEEEEDEVMGEDQRREALAKAFERTETPGGMVLLGRGTAVGFGLARGAFGLTAGQGLVIVG